MTRKIGGKNFKTENENIWNWNRKEKKFRDPSGKVFTACFLRELFESLLCLSSEDAIDAIEVLS